MNRSNSGRRKVGRALREDECGLVVYARYAETSKVNFVLGLMGFPLDRGWFKGGEFIVFLVLLGDRSTLGNLLSDLENEISFDQKAL